jgi:hypothetical protein
VGQAVPRSSAPPRPIVVTPRYPYYSLYRSPWTYGAFGLGYRYDPYQYGYGYGYYPYAGSGYYAPYGSYGSYSAYDYDTGALRLKVKPRDAQVFVDGYFMGVVDSYDGLLQRLRLDSGPHRIEIRAAGYEPLVFDVRIVPGETVNYKGELLRLP